MQIFLRAISRASLIASFGWCAACAGLNEEREGVRAIAERHLDCANGIVSRLDVDDGNLLERHWIAGCNHQSIRVTCTHRGCSEEVQPVHLLCDLPIGVLARGDAGAATPVSSVAAELQGVSQ
jgi:hypothetical protein